MDEEAYPEIISEALEILFNSSLDSWLKYLYKPSGAGATRGTESGVSDRVVYKGHIPA